MLENMNEFRCPNCNKLFFKYRVKGSLTVEVKCTKCNQISTLIVDKGWIDEDSAI